MQSRVSVSRYVWVTYRYSDLSEDVSAESLKGAPELRSTRSNKATLSLHSLHSLPHSSNYEPHNEELAHSKILIVNYEPLGGS